ncbi:MAG: GNAT family N-acetyltransferase [Phenylobacterium sp.]
MSDILIRASEPEDIADLTEVLNQPRAVWGTMQFPFTSVAERRRKYEGRPDTHLVAEIEGKVIGTLGLVRNEGRRGHAATLGMAVHDAYAGRGAGTALMAAIVEQADRWLNVQRLELFVWTDNVRAIALYERFGFEREGVFRSYAWRDGAYVDAISMARLRP